MCYEVGCNKCGKVSWGGCGRHVPSVYARIPQGRHCLCKNWPGVSLAASGSDSDQNPTTTSPAPEASSPCAIL